MLNVASMSVLLYTSYQFFINLIVFSMYPTNNGDNDDDAMTIDDDQRLQLFLPSTYQDSQCSFT